MINIKSRRSKRCFLERSIPDEIIKEIIEAGCYAPSALNKQPWKFIVITNKDSIKRLSCIVKDITAKIAKYLTVLKLFKPVFRDPQVVAALRKTIATNTDTVFYNAPLLILIVSEKREPYAIKDCALASQNMMLYAHSLGISSCYIGRAEILKVSRAAKEIIGLPPRHTIQSAIVFGYAPEGEDDSIIPKRRQDNVINWVR
jgi:nitroreductase